MAERVALARCESYHLPVLENCLKKLLGLLGGIGEFVKNGDRVLIKINLLSGKPPEKAVTTHPNLVEAVVNLVKEAGGIPAIGDSPGGRATLTGLARAYRTAGFEEVSRKTGVPLVSFEDDVIEVGNSRGRLYKKFKVTKQIKDFDVIISVPKLKTHPLTYITAGVKNNFGFIPGLRKTEFHLKLPDSELFSQMLIDLLDTVKIDLVILDAIVSMEGNGPAGGTPRKVGAILVSKNPVALDFVACKLIGYKNALDIPTNRIAVERKMFLPGNIEISGEKIEDLQVKDFKRIPRDVSRNIPQFLLKWLKNLLSPKPKIIEKLCNRCLYCLESCPVKCVGKTKNGKPSIDYSDCIRCFCCQELCSQGAIITKSPWWVKLFTA
ncbi:MAG: DUF362 domain-containing protein [Elusimicrobiota bacterium]|nr:DUF362 domain-containing protein [Elusimicrobiota bacterium]MDH5662386.1 DUF362 domain-containing protein [Elusimicrobiota bacterium]